MAFGVTNAQYMLLNPLLLGDVEQSEQAANTLGSFNKLFSYASIVIIALLLIISIS